MCFTRCCRNSAPPSSAGSQYQSLHGRDPVKRVQLAHNACAEGAASESDRSSATSMFVRTKGLMDVRTVPEPLPVAGSTRSVPFSVQSVESSTQLGRQISLPTLCEAHCGRFHVVSSGTACFWSHWTTNRDFFGARKLAEKEMESDWCGWRRWRCAKRSERICGRKQSRLVLQGVYDSPEGCVKILKRIAQYPNEIEHFI